VIAAARAQRAAEGGLPVDDATLELVADAVTDPGWQYPGLYLTVREARDEVPEPVVRQVAAYLGQRPAIAGGTRLGWRDGRRVVIAAVTEDVEHHRAVLTAIGGDRVLVEEANVAADDLWTLATRIWLAEEELRAEGVYLDGEGPMPDEEEGIIEVSLRADDREAARRVVAQRFGSHVRPRWLGDPEPGETPIPRPPVAVDFVLLFPGAAAGGVRPRPDLLSERIEAELKPSEDFVGYDAGPTNDGLRKVTLMFEAAAPDRLVSVALPHIRTADPLPGSYYLIGAVDSTAPDARTPHPI
jgi:hypothetical protein